MEELLGLVGLPDLLKAFLALIQPKGGPIGNRIFILIGETLLHLRQVNVHTKHRCVMYLFEC